MKRLKSNFWKDWIFTLFIIIISLVFILLPFVWKDSEKVSYFGNIGGATLGIIGAYLVMRYQINREREQAEEEKQPLLVTGIVEGNKLPFQFGKDLHTNLKPLSSKEPFSDVTIDLINGGTTPIFNLKCILNIPDLKEQVAEYSKYNNNKASLKFSDNLKEMEMFSYTFRNEENKKNIFWQIQRIEGDSFMVIMPGMKESVHLPSSFILLMSFWISNIYSNTGDVKTTYLDIELHYQDYKLNDKCETIRIYQSKCGLVSNVNTTSGLTSVSFTLDSKKLLN